MEVFVIFIVPIVLATLIVNKVYQLFMKFFGISFMKFKISTKIFLIVIVTYIISESLSLIFRF